MWHILFGKFLSMVENLTLSESIYVLTVTGAHICILLGSCIRWPTRMMRLSLSWNMLLWTLLELMLFSIIFVETIEPIEIFIISYFLLGINLIHYIHVLTNQILLFMRWTHCILFLIFIRSVIWNARSRIIWFKVWNSRYFILNQSCSKVWAGIPSIKRMLRISFKY